jgi:hypothetical protein
VDDGLYRLRVAWFVLRDGGFAVPGSRRTGWILFRGGMLAMLVGSAAFGGVSPFFAAILAMPLARGAIGTGLEYDRLPTILSAPLAEPIVRYWRPDGEMTLWPPKT